MPKILLGYVPVPHRGYWEWFRSHHDAHALYVLGEDFLSEFSHLAKDIRALPPKLVCAAIEGWRLFPVHVLGRHLLERLKQETDVSIVMPAEEVSREFRERYLPHHDVSFENVFLRWDRDSSRDKKPVEHNRVISVLGLDREFMKMASAEAEKGSDWWRRVGAVLVSCNQVVIVARAHHLPTEHTPYIDGDPRSNFKRGVNIELSTAIHAEAAVLAEAARRGIATEGASLYVTTFPCPPCAKLVACSGITKLYFAEGYGILDGEEVLKSANVEIVFIGT